MPNARLITGDTETHGQVHFEHAVEAGVGYAQLWFEGTFHLEFTKPALQQLAREAAELAEGL